MGVATRLLALCLLALASLYTAAMAADHVQSDEANGTPKVALMFLVRRDIPQEAVWESFLLAAAELQLKARPPPPPAEQAMHLPDSPLDDSIVSSKCYTPSWLRQQRAKSRKLLQQDRDGDKNSAPTKKAASREPTGGHAARVDHGSKHAGAHWLSRRCGMVINGTRVYEQQSLFSVYVHRAPGAPSSALGSIFYGRDIQMRVQTGWGRPTLVTAQRLLIAEALKDPLNVKFMLLSEACVPLYHPALVWAQLVAEGAYSRVGNETNNDPYRWADEMATSHFQRHHWKKSSQWTVLSRRHAAIVANDQHVFPKFLMFCRQEPHCNDGLAWRVCYADEHYVPSLLNALNESALTDNIGHATFSDWRIHPAAHPGTFLADRVTPTWLLYMRAQGIANATGCHTQSRATNVAALFERKSMCKDDNTTTGHATTPADQAQLPVAWAFRAQWDRSVPIVANLTDKLRSSGSMEGFVPMNTFCPLFARKIAPEAAPTLASLAWSCDGLGFSWECLGRAGAS